jgi:hypothetical protein
MKLIASSFVASIILASSLLLAGPAMAGGGHDHGHGHSHAQVPVDKTVAEANGGKVIASLVSRKKVDQSWAGVAATSVEKKMTQGNPEWVIIYNNAKVEEADKQKIYVFLTISGDYIAANYTGK